MSCFTVQVLEPSKNIIEVETCRGDTVSLVTVENSYVPNIELSQCVSQLPSDFNDRIAASISGILPTKQYRNINSSYSIQTGDDTIFVDCSLSNVILSLPSASNLGGKQFHIKRKSGNYGLTVTSSGSETIDNSQSFTLHSNYQAITLISDNTNWFII